MNKQYNQSNKNNAVVAINNGKTLHVSEQQTCSFEEFMNWTYNQFNNKINVNNSQ